MICIIIQYCIVFITKYAWSDMSKSSYILIKIDFHIVIISITSQRTEKKHINSCWLSRILMPHGSEQISQSPCQIERYIGNLPVHLMAHLREAYCSLRQILPDESPEWRGTPVLLTLYLYGNQGRIMLKHEINLHILRAVVCRIHAELPLQLLQGMVLAHWHLNWWTTPS